MVMKSGAIQYSDEQRLGMKERKMDRKYLNQ
jgi:hypothetical protein